MFNVNWVKVLRQLGSLQSMETNSFRVSSLFFFYTCNRFGYLLVLIRGGSSQTDYNKTVAFKVNLSASGMPSS